MEQRRKRAGICSVKSSRAREVGQHGLSGREKSAEGAGG